MTIVEGARGFNTLAKIFAKREILGAAQLVSSELMFGLTYSLLGNSNLFHARKFLLMGKFIFIFFNQ